MRHSKRLTMLLTVATCIALLLPAAAHGAGTGDDPRRTKDVLTPAEARVKEREDGKFAAWESSKTATVAASRTNRARAQAVIGGELYEYLYTPSHRQERSYWCGPASSQILVDYWGPSVTQSTLAAYMGTTTDGTDFSKVDDCLRHFTGRSYYYYGGVTTFAAFMDQVEYGIGVKYYPMVADVTIDGSWWPYYVYDHAGHILPIEAFDERITPYHVRVNDPYDEAYWHSGGGTTYGHTTYDAYFVQGGVAAHWRHAVIR
jgi:hypothetical protein